jgi:hypothetical protein
MGRDPAVTDLLLAPCDYCWRVWPAQLWVARDRQSRHRAGLGLAWLAFKGLLYHQQPPDRAG